MTTFRQAAWHLGKIGVVFAWALVAASITYLLGVFGQPLLIIVLAAIATSAYMLLTLALSLSKALAEAVN